MYISHEYSNSHCVVFETSHSSTETLAQAYFGHCRPNVMNLMRDP